MVFVPAEFKTTVNGDVPAANAALPGSVALESLDEIATKSDMVLTRFQFASTAFTVTLNEPPAA
jgi:hypothetical protein